MKVMSKAFLTVWFRSQQCIVCANQPMCTQAYTFFFFYKRNQVKLKGLVWCLLEACQYFRVVEEKACFSLSESMIWINVQCMGHSQLKLTYSCNIQFYRFNNIGFCIIRINFKNSNYQILRVKLVRIALTVLRNFAIFSFIWAANILFVSSFQIVK